MLDNRIGAEVRRINRNLSVVVLVSLGGILAIAIVNLRYWRNFFTGPVDAGPQLLLNVEDPNFLDRYYVKINATSAAEAGFQEIEQETDKSSGRVSNEKVTATYFLVRVVNRLLLVKSPKATAQSFYIGALVATPDDVREKIVEIAKKESADWSKIGLPFMLDASDFTSFGYWWLSAVALLAGGALILAVKVFRRAANPLVSPVVQSISRYGMPEVVCAQIDADMTQTGHQLGKTSLIVSKAWIFKSEAFDLKIIRLTDLLWIYTKVLTRRAYGIVPINRSYSIVLRDRFGAAVETGTNKKIATSLLRELSQSAPWVIVGYTTKLEGLYKNNLREFANAVDERRRSVTATD